MTPEDQIAEMDDLQRRIKALPTDALLYVLKGVEAEADSRMDTQLRGLRKYFTEDACQALARGEPLIEPLNKEPLDPLEDPKFLLRVVAAEFKSDPMSVQCFDATIVKAVINLAEEV